MSHIFGSGSSGLGVTGEVSHSKKLCLNLSIYHYLQYVLLIVSFAPRTEIKGMQERKKLCLLS